MAELDAAGPGSTGGPKARTLTREDLPRLAAEADREWQSLTPAERAQRKAEAAKADREAYEAARRAALPTLEALERMAETASRAAKMAGGLDAGAARLGIPPGPPYEPASIPPGLGHHQPLDLSDFEFEPAASLSAEDIRAVADAVKAALAHPEGGRKRKRTVEGLNVSQWVAAMAAADPTFRHLSQREAAKLGTFAARTIGTCELWIQMKADLEAEALEKAEKAKAELEDRLGEDEDGFRQSSTKHGIGIQRATREDLKHERDVDAFLRANGEQPRKKRTK